MRKINYTLLVATVMVAPALAQSNGKAPKDLKPEIVKCANAATSLKRLACFDDLTKSLGIDKSSATAGATQASAKQASAPGDDKQAGRLKLIQDLIQKGAFSKVLMRGSVSQAWVTPAFYMLDFDVKSKFAGLVWEYYLQDSNGAANLTLLYDSKTGKQVGSFSKMGLRLD